MRRALTRRRLEVPGGIYYVVLQGSRSTGAFKRQLLFASLEDWNLLERCLDWTLRNCGAQLYAYCVLPDSIHLVVKVSDCRMAFGQDCLALLVKRLAGRYTQLRNRRTHRRGQLYSREYTAKLVEEKYLLNVIRHVHLRPAATRVAKGPDRYLWTSHHAYRQIGRIKCLTVTVATKMLTHDPSRIREKYDLYMSQSESPETYSLIDLGAPEDSRVIGDRSFIRRVAQKIATYKPQVSRAELLAAVATLLDVTSEDIISKEAHGTRVAQARALVAWQAIRNGMRPQDIARWLNRTWPTLLVGIERQRGTDRDLFDRQLEDLLKLSESHMAAVAKRSLRTSCV